MTIWWAFPLALSAVQVLAARKRDLGSAVISLYAMVVMLSDSPLDGLQWIGILIGLLSLVISWWRGSSCGVWRPRLNGLALAVVGVSFAAHPILNGWAVQLPSTELHLGTAALCGFSSVIFFVLALERPRPRPLRYSARRTIPVTTGQQTTKESAS